MSGGGWQGLPLSPLRRRREPGAWRAAIGAVNQLQVEESLRRLHGSCAPRVVPSVGPARNLVEAEKLTPCGTCGSRSRMISGTKVSCLGCGHALPDEPRARVVGVGDLAPIGDDDFTWRWAFHNVVAHPLLVICPPLGEWLHERTSR